MSARHVWRGTGVLAALGLAALACFQDPVSPAQCPAFCPGRRLTAVESLLATSIQRDSSFQGYVPAHQSLLLLASDEQGVDSRPIFEAPPIATRVLIDTGSDTTTGPIVVDSMKLTLFVLRRSAALRNLRLSIYQLPLGIDSTSTLAGLAPAFAAAPLRVVNVDSLLAAPGLRDSATGDTVLHVDSLHNVVTVRIKFSAAQALFNASDSGKLALGVRVSADSLASIALGSSRLTQGPTVTWFARVDSAGTIVQAESLPHAFPDSQLRGVRFNSFVFTAPPPTLDSNLTIGAVPSIRARLRIDLPRVLRDSAQIIRAILQLVPTGTAPVAMPDSVFVQVRRLTADLGAKSPAALDTFVANSPPFRGAPTDTVRIEMTTLFRLWQADTNAVTAVYVSLLSADSLLLRGFEGASFSTLRFYSSRSAAFRPSILLTFVPRLKFGAP